MISVRPEVFPLYRALTQWRETAMYTKWKKMLLLLFVLINYISLSISMSLMSFLFTLSLHKSGESIRSFSVSRRWVFSRKQDSRNSLKEEKKIGKKNEKLKKKNWKKLKIEKWWKKWKKKYMNEYNRLRIKKIMEQ